MKFGILYAYWTHEWYGDYVAFAQKTKALGFDILEVSPGQLMSAPEREIAELRAVAEDLGLTITTNIGPAKDKDISSKDPQVRKAGIAFLTDVMKMMDQLDSRALVGVLYSYWPCQFDDLDKPAIWARGVESVKTLGRVAQDLGIDYCLEVVNRFETNILNTSEEGVRFCKDVDCPSVKLLLDTFHMNIEEDNIADAIRYAGEYLGHLHVGEGNRKLPGQGSLPWKEIGKALRDIRFTKGVVMEPFVTMGGKVGEDIKVWRDLSGGADTETMDKNLQESLIFLRNAFLQ
jgi:D-psicose/D-tagatose/L-ribulose 3-epimerase